MGETEFGEEVRVACSDHAVAREQSRVAMVGVQPISLPGIVPEHHVGAEFANHARHVAACREVAVEFTIDTLEEPHLARRVAGQPASRIALLVLPPCRERHDVGRWVPRSLGTVGAHEVVHRATGSCPLREEATTTELDVVGMRPDRECRARRDEVERHPVMNVGWGLPRIVCSHGGSTSRIDGWARSAGVSRSSDRSGSARTSTAICAGARAKA